MPAIHLFRGLPLVLVPIGFHCNILLVDNVLLCVIYQLNVAVFMYVTQISRYITLL
jgi:hypothetical protein